MNLTWCYQKNHILVWNILYEIWTKVTYTTNNRSIVSWGGKDEGTFLEWWKSLVSWLDGGLSNSLNHTLTMVPFIICKLYLTNELLKLKKKSKGFFLTGLREKMRSVLSGCVVLGKKKIIKLDVLRWWQLLNHDLITASTCCLPDTLLSVLLILFNFHTLTDNAIMV